MMSLNVGRIWGGGSGANVGRVLAQSCVTHSWVGGVTLLGVPRRLLPLLFFLACS